MKRPWCWEKLRAGGEGDNRGRDHWISITDAMEMSLSRLWELVMDMEAWHAASMESVGSMVSQRARHDWATEQYWTFFEDSTFSWSFYVFFILWNFFLIYLWWLHACCKKIFLVRLSLFAHFSEQKHRLFVPYYLWQVLLIYSKQPWNIKIVSPFRPKNKFEYSLKR